MTHVQGGLYLIVLEAVTEILLSVLGSAEAVNYTTSLHTRIDKTRTQYVVYVRRIVVD